SDLLIFWICLLGSFEPAVEMHLTPSTRIDPSERGTSPARVKGPGFPAVAVGLAFCSLLGRFGRLFELLNEVFHLALAELQMDRIDHSNAALGELCCHLLKRPPSMKVGRGYLVQ